MGKSLDGSVVLSAQQHGSWEREQVAVRDLERRKFRSFHGERHPRSRDPKKIFILGHPDVEDAGLYNRSGRIATRGIRPSRLGSAGSKETYEEEPRLISRRDGLPGRSRVVRLSNVFKCFFERIWRTTTTKKWYACSSGACFRVRGHVAIATNWGRAGGHRSTYRRSPHAEYISSTREVYVLIAGLGYHSMLPQSDATRMGI